MVVLRNVAVLLLGLFCVRAMGDQSQASTCQFRVGNRSWRAPSLLRHQGGSQAVASSLRGGGNGVEGTVRHQWNRYQSQVDRTPVPTKTWTALALYAAADVIGQKLASRGGLGFHWDGRRTAVQAGVGALMGGVVLHHWYAFLERQVATGTQDKYARVIRMLLVDQTVGAAVMTAGSLAVRTLLQAAVTGSLLPFDSLLSSIVSKVDNNMWPAVKAGWQLWPFANFINFLCIRPNLRVLFSNIVTVVFGLASYV